MAINIPITSSHLSCTIQHPKNPHTYSILTHYLSEMAGKFEPKHKVDLDPPKDDIISLDYLAKCDGSCSVAKTVLD